MTSAQMLVLAGCIYVTPHIRPKVAILAGIIFTLAGIIVEWLK